ncbi:6552_t:CDS:2, partial [Funneliformis geosporum]
MTIQVSTPKPFDRDTRGGLSQNAPDCITCKLPKETVSSVLENIAKKTAPPKHESSLYTVSADWISSLASSITNELSAVLNAPSNHYVETGKTIANIVSSVGNGTWKVGNAPVNALKDIETNFPLYISDYFDQLSGWSRENVFEQSCSRIGSDIAELSLGGPSPAENPNGLEPALSGKYVKISWKLPNIDNISFDSEGEPNDGEVYRYFAFIDTFKHAISMNEDGSITKELYNFSDPAQLWRICKFYFQNYGNFYALYNKKYKTYLGRSLEGNNSKPDNDIHETAVYLVEDPETHAYSIGYRHHHAEIEYLLKDLNL